MKWFKVLAVLALLILAVSAGASVARADAPHKKCQAVVPEAANELNPSEFKVSIDGNQVKVSGHGLVKPGQA